MAEWKQKWWRPVNIKCCCMFLVNSFLFFSTDAGTLHDITEVLRKMIRLLGLSSCNHSNVQTPSLWLILTSLNIEHLTFREQSVIKLQLLLNEFDHRWHVDVLLNTVCLCAFCVLSHQTCISLDLLFAHSGRPPSLHYTCRCIMWHPLLMALCLGLCSCCFQLPRAIITLWYNNYTLIWATPGWTLNILTVDVQIWHHPTSELTEARCKVTGDRAGSSQSAVILLLSTGGLYSSLCSGGVVWWPIWDYNVFQSYWVGDDTDQTQKSPTVVVCLHRLETWDRWGHSSQSGWPLNFYNWTSNLHLIRLLLM